LILVVEMISSAKAGLLTARVKTIAPTISDIAEIADRDRAYVWIDLSDFSMS